MIRHAPATGFASQAMLCRNQCSSSSNTRRPGRASVPVGKFHGYSTAESFCRFSGKSDCLGTWSWSASLAIGLMKISGTGMVMSGSNAPGGNVSSVNEWILGTTTSSTAVDEFDGANPDDSHHYLFSRSGQPVALSVWVVSRAWLVSICSGVTLLIGFFTIFSKIRFRTIWLGTAAIGLLAAILFQGSVMFLALQYAFIGMALTLLGLVIERSLERSRSPSISVRDSGLAATPQTVESSLNQAPSVGSDDSTAIRVRAPSTTTLDYVPTSISVPQPIKDEARGSSLERARAASPPG